MKAKMFRILCMIMVVVILFSVTVQPPAKALLGALVGEPIELALVAAMLISMGYTFSNVGDLQKATQSLVNDLGSSLKSLVDGVVEAGETGFKIGASAGQWLGNLIDGIKSKKQGDALVIPDGSKAILFDDVSTEIRYYDPVNPAIDIYGSTANEAARVSGYYNLYDEPLEIKAGDYIYTYLVEPKGTGYLRRWERKSVLTGSVSAYNSSYGSVDQCVFFVKCTTSSGKSYLVPQLVWSDLKTIVGWSLTPSKWTYSTTSSFNPAIPLDDLYNKPGSLSIPVGQIGDMSPEEFWERMQEQLKNGEVTLNIPEVYTDLQNPALDAPVTATQAGVLEGTGILNPAIPLDPPIAGEPWDNVANGWPALTTLFPFCIPFDIAAMIKAFVATPEAPVFRVSFPAKIFPGGGAVEMDMGQFDTIAVIVRVIVLISFIFGLMVLTGKVIRW